METLLPYLNSHLATIAYVGLMTGLMILSLLRSKVGQIIGATVVYSGLALLCLGGFGYLLLPDKSLAVYQSAGWIDIGFLGPAFLGAVLAAGIDSHRRRWPIGRAPRYRVIEEESAPVIQTRKGRFSRWESLSFDLASPEDAEEKVAELCYTWRVSHERALDDRWAAEHGQEPEPYRPSLEEELPPAGAEPPRKDWEPDIKSEDGRYALTFSRQGVVIWQYAEDGEFEKDSRVTFFPRYRQDAVDAAAWLRAAADHMETLQKDTHN